MGGSFIGMKHKVYYFVEQMYCRFQDDEVSALGAQMTYYLILAFFPFLIFLMTMFGYTSVSTADILQNLSPLIAGNLYKTIEEFINGLLLSRNTTLLSFGMIGTIWAASSGVLSIIKGLNRAYDEAETRPFWKVRSISMLFTLALGVVLLLSFVLLIFGEGVGEHVFQLIHSPANFDTIWNFTKYGIPLTTMLFVLVCLYKIIPNRRINFREVIPGSLFAAFGWIATSLSFAFYVNNWGHYTKTYGSIGGVIVLLVWLYLSSIIILLGGQINATLTSIREGTLKKSCKKFGLSWPIFKKRRKGKIL